MYLIISEDILNASLRLEVNFRTTFNLEIKWLCERVILPNIYHWSKLT